MSSINKSKKAAIYIRVSTDFQAEEGYSIEAQKEQLTAYCVSKGIKNYDYYIDGGWSGSNMERPEMQRLIKDAKEDKISHVIVYKLDRLSRSQKDTLYLIEDVFNPHGVDFVSLNENMDTSTPMGRLMLGILSAFAQLERENIRMRTRMGMKERVKSGLWMGGGRVPFGYDYDKNDGILIPNKDAEKVKQIYSLYIDGKSPQEIANLLGLKYDRLVYQILTRKSNYGIIEYNGEEYQGKHKPIISKEIYDKAMQCMIERSVTRTSISENLLTGLVYCGKCGAKMRYQQWGKKGHKLACYSQQKSKPYLIKDPNCSQEKVWADEIEQEVLNYLFKRKEEKFEDDSITEETNTLQLLNNQHMELQKKIKRLYILYAKAEDDIILETIEEEKNKIKQIEEKILRETENATVKNMRKESADILSNLSDIWDYMSIKEKQHAMRLLLNKVTINDNEISIDIKI